MEAVKENMEVVGPEKALNSVIENVHYINTLPAWNAIIKKHFDDAHPVLGLKVYNNVWKALLQKLIEVDDKFIKY